MLIQYTPISTLSEGELEALKSAILGTQLEGHYHFTFNGKTFNISELNAQKQVWKSAHKPGQLLFG